MTRLYSDSYASWLLDRFYEENTTALFSVSVSFAQRIPGIIQSDSVRRSGSRRVGRQRDADKSSESRRAQSTERRAVQVTRGTRAKQKQPTYY